MVEQVVRTAEEKAAAKARAKSKRGKGPKSNCKPGRPKGSNNQAKTQVELTPELRLIKTMMQQLFTLINGVLPLAYLGLDRHFGNNHALLNDVQCGLHLISKLRHDAALYFPYDGPYSGRGLYRKYSDKLDYHHIPVAYLKETSVDDDIQTCLYQLILLHKTFAQPLNAVIIVKTNLKSPCRSQVVLFSRDLDLAFDWLINYY